MAAYKQEPSSLYFAKYLLFGMNFLTFVGITASSQPNRSNTNLIPPPTCYPQALGACLLAMSLWVRSDSGLWVYTENLSIERYYWACYFGMAAGGLLFLVSFVGCAGTLLDSRLMFGIVSRHQQVHCRAARR